MGFEGQEDERGGDADQDAIVRDVPAIKQNISFFNLSDIWNADECGLFNKMVPDRTISQIQLAGRKKGRTRITFLPCCNADGSEKCPLMIIGKAHKPRPFKGKTLPCQGSK